jgi:hypothetical protein
MAESLKSDLSRGGYPPLPPPSGLPDGAGFGVGQIGGQAGGDFFGGGGAVVGSGAGV